MYAIRSYYGEELDGAERDRAAAEAALRAAESALHVAEHDEYWGSATCCLSTSAFFSRNSNSVPSSIIVRSAVKLVSNTPSKPKWRKAVVILPVTSVPGS